MLDKNHPAFFFQCGDEDLFSVTPDKAGTNLPRSSCTEGWLLRQEFVLSIADEAPEAIDPKRVVRRIGDQGFYIWRAD